jgi:hypothetical protein
MTYVRSAAIAGLLLAFGCRSEDPRLPMQLYDEAIHLNQEGKNLEARMLMQQLADKYPDTLSGQQASKDLFLLDALLRQDLQDRQRLVHSGMKRTADALTRYKDKHGEYPRYLSSLVPEYLDQDPETPWKHPYFYRPFVSTPILDLKDRHGRASQVFSSKFDSYYLVCLGVDLQPGGQDLAADTFVVNGEFVKLSAPPPIPLPQPQR